MVLLNDLIRVYDNVLDADVCDSLIHIFDSNEDKHEKVDEQKKPCFTQFNVTQFSDDHKDIHNLLIKETFKYRDDYYKFVDKRVFPEKHAFEQFRIKRYEPNGEDMFDTHVDVGTYASARRFLSFMWYLNDVPSGGNTVFDGLTIKPERGKLVVFPPLWMFPHRGEPVTESSKYILSTYLHYI
jgi:hypothetical protein|tara:strand:- start:420 stop:968 length:549 start_codon:yes stop_codon:yes gene_type:complete